MARLKDGRWEMEDGKIEGLKDEKIERLKEGVWFRFCMEMHLCFKKFNRKGRGDLRKGRKELDG